MRDMRRVNSIIKKEFDFTNKFPPYIAFLD